MKYIPLTRGYRAMIDDEDFDRVSKIQWHVRTRSHNRNVYAASNPGEGGNSKDLYMHRFIAKAAPGEMIDHKDRNGLNNQKSNLRKCDRTVNGLNSRRSVDNTSGFTGVSWDKGMKRWRARVNLFHKEIILGYFSDKQDAVRMREQYVTQAIQERT